MPNCKTTFLTLIILLKGLFMIWIIGFILFILLLGIKFNIKLTYNKLIFKKIIVIVTTTYALYTMYI